jgi:peroxiredoxin
MKKQRYLLPLLFLLPGTLLAQKLRLEPEKPRPGQSVKVTYDPAGTKLADAPGVTLAVYHLRPGGFPIVQVLTLVRTGGTYQTTLAVPDTIKALAIVAESGEMREANDEQGYLTLLYGTDGKPVVSSAASLAEAYQGHWDVIGTEVREAKKARGLFEQEFSRFPAQKRKFMQSYLYTFGPQFSPKQEAERAQLLRELDQFKALPNLTADELSVIANGYQRAGKDDLAKAIQEKRAAQFGLSKREAYAQLFRTFSTNQPLPLAQRANAYEELIRQFPADPEPYHYQYRDQAYSIYLRMLADSGMTTAFEALMKAAPANDESRMRMQLFNQFAWNWAEQNKNLPQAAELSHQATKWAKTQLNAPRGPGDLPSLTDAQLRQRRESTYAMYADTYGFVLQKQGNQVQALPYLEAAAKTYGKLKNTEYNERYLTVLEAVRPEAVRADAEAMVKIGTANAAIEKLLHLSFMRKPVPGSEYESYLSGLKKTAAAARLAEVRAAMISRPAPAFSLVDLNGKSVDLASLKGKIVVVDFWATWCRPCIASFPGMQKAQARFEGNPDVVFLFVNSWQSEADKRKNAADFIAKNGYPFTVLMDEQDEVIRAFKVTGIPTKFIVDKTGTIRFKKDGYNSSPEVQMEEIVMMVELANESAPAGR